jgi:hypothetical protein
MFDAVGIKVRIMDNSKESMLKLSNEFQNVSQIIQKIGEKK